MIRNFLHPVRVLIEVLSDPDSTRRIVLGFTVGMMVGLVPKGNLTAAALLLIVLATRVNLPAAFASAGLFTWVGMWTDPLAHRMGLSILTRESVQPIGAWLYDLPVVPWTALNNTVVLGSLLLGLVLFFPIYYITSEALDRNRTKIAERLEQYHTAKALAIAEVVARRKMR